MSQGAQQKKAGGKADGKKGPGSGDLGGDVGEKLRKLIKEHGEDELKLGTAIKQLVPAWQGPMARLILSKELSPEEAEKVWEAAHGPPVVSEPPKDQQVKAGPGAQAALAQADELGAHLSGSLKQMTAAPEALLAPLHKAKPNVAAATMTRLHQQRFDEKRSLHQVLDEMTQGGARALLAMGAAVKKDDKDDDKDDDKGGGGGGSEKKKLDFKSGPARAWASKIVAAMSQKGAIDSVMQVAGNAPAWAGLRLALKQEPSKLPEVVENLLDQVEKLLSDMGSKEIVPDELAARIKAVIGPVTARLHTGPEANKAAAEHGAKAVAVGEDVFFAQGQFKPGSPEGDFLIAHELAHVAQAQKKSLDKAAPMAMTSGRVVDEAEVQADLQASLVVASGNYDTKVPAAPGPTGFAKDDGQRSAQLAAQQQRIALASGGGGGAAPAEAGAAGGAGGAGGAAPEAAPAAAPAEAAPAAPGGAGDDASSAGAYTKVMSANPSSQPDDWEKAGEQASTKLKDETQKAAESVPPLPVEMEGTNANGKGAASGGGAAAEVNAKGEGANPTAEPPPAKDAPPPPEQSAGTDQKLASVGEDKEKLKTQGQEVIQNLKTSDPNLKTDPGPSPVVELSGGSDPAATVSAEGQAKQQASDELQKQRDKILAGPGPAQVQPIKVEEQLKVTPSDMPVVPMPTLPPVEGMGQLKGWAQHTSNAAIKSSFDNIAKPKLDASIEPAKDQLAKASTEKDESQKKAVTEAQSKVAQANAEAQAKQTEAVAGARTQISTAQQDTLNKQKAAVADLESKATSKRAETIAKVDARVQADQANIQSQYQNAEKQADDAQKKAEDDAKKKKEEADAKSKEGSWWDQAVDAVTSAIKDVASAIDGILSAVRDAVGKIIDTVKNAACALIDAAASFITSAISAFGDFLKDLVNATLGQLFPELAAALNSLIDSAVAAAKKAVEFIAENLKKAVTAFFDGLKASFNALISAYQAAVQAAATFATALVTGDWSLVGKMLLEGILKLCGIDPGAFYALVGEAKDTIDLILDDPAGFAGHVVDAVKLGFSQFGGNFWDHLKDGLVNWLFGTLGDAGITIPARFDVAGIFDLCCQVLGLTYPRLRAKAVKLIGEKNVERIEFIWKYVEALLTGGWAGLWEKIQDDLGTLWNTVMDGIKSYLIETIVKQAIMKVATMWNPAGAIIQLLITAWNVYCWVKENAQRIFGLIQAVVTSMSNIAHGDISGAANYIEQSLAKLIPIAISFLADLIGLGGIADKIKEVIGEVQAAIDGALDKLIAKIQELFTGKVAGPGGDAQKPDHIGEPTTFTAGDHEHKLWVKVENDQPNVMVASEPAPVDTQVGVMRGDLDKISDEGKKSEGAQLLGAIGPLVVQVKQLAQTAIQATDPAAASEPVAAPQAQLANALKAAFDFFAQQSDIEAPEKLKATDVELGKIQTELSMKIYDGATTMPILSKGGDAKATAYAIRTQHPSNSEWDKGSKTLTLPPVRADEVKGAADPAAMGAAIGNETGVGDVSLKREGKNFTIAATVGATATVAHGAVGVDERIEKAVQGDLLIFLKIMGIKGSCGGLSLATLNELCDLDKGGAVNFDWLKDKFRDIEPYEGTYHEWVPSNLILKVVNYIKSRESISEKAKAAKLIDLQNELRVDTGWVIFRPSRAIWHEEVKNDATGEVETVSVMCGHTGAIKYGKKGASSTTGQQAFHDALRDACEPSFDNPGAMIDKIIEIFTDWVWKGGETEFEHPLEPTQTDKGGTPIAGNIGAIQSAQESKFQEILQQLNAAKAKYGS